MAIKKYKEYDEKGRLKEVGTQIDGVKQGSFSAYQYIEATDSKKIDLGYLTMNQPGKPYRKRKILSSYKDGSANGEYKIFENNLLIEEGTFVNGLAEGPFKAYEPHYSIKKNIINTFLSYFFRKKSGLFIEGQYKRGRYHGEIRFKGYPWEKGDICHCNYQNGIEHGMQRVVKASGELRSVLSWKEGQKHGLEKEYHDNGALESVATYQNGKLHGLKKQYTEDGRLEYLHTYKHGVRHGPYREREIYYDSYTRMTDITLERGFYDNDKKKGTYIWHNFTPPFKPKKGSKDPNWLREQHQEY